MSKLREALQRLRAHEQRCTACKNAREGWGDACPEADDLTEKVNDAQEIDDRERKGNYIHDFFGS